MSSLGAGMMRSGTKGTVDALASFGTLLVAGGLFDTAGGTAARNIASWDGSSWQDMSTGIATAPEEVVALAVYDSQLFAATYNPLGGAGNISRVYRWTGTAWTQVGAGGDDAVFALASFNNALQAGGRTSIPSAEARMPRAGPQ